MNEPLPSSDVRRLSKALIVAGTVIYSDHALSEMAKDKLTKPEVERVLRGGSAGEGEWLVALSDGDPGHRRRDRIPVRDRAGDRNRLEETSIPKIINASTPSTEAGDRNRLEERR